MRIANLSWTEGVFASAPAPWEEKKKLKSNQQHI
jgi:hypothetical protein